MIRKNKKNIQMSEAFITSVFLALSGGFQDAYTYFTRDQVFSNAQTGNVVLMSQHFMAGEWMRGLREQGRRRSDHPLRLHRTGYGRTLQRV